MALSALISASKNLAGMVGALKNAGDGNGDFSSSVIAPAASIASMMTNQRRAITNESIRGMFNNTYTSQ